MVTCTVQIAREPLAQTTRSSEKVNYFDTIPHRSADYQASDRKPGAL